MGRVAGEDHERVERPAGKRFGKSGIATSRRAIDHARPGHAAGGHQQNNRQCAAHGENFPLDNGSSERIDQPIMRT